jgi:uncharacterized protein (DUF1697 family)
VGGKNILPMKELVVILENLGCRNVKTCIQSGNVVFQSEDSNTTGLSSRIGVEVRKSHGFEPYVLLMRFTELDKAITANPFPEAESKPATLHLGFLASAPGNPDLKALEGLKIASERFHLRKNLFYLHAPEGIGRSKLAAKVERLLGVTMTTRNWRTVCKIRDMVNEPG